MISKETPSLSAFIRYLESAVKTGSRVFGVHTEVSDIDIVLQPSDAQDLGKYHNFICQTPDGDDYNENGFITFRVPGTLYNIILCHDDETYENWIRATTIMKACCIRSNDFKMLIRDKFIRVSIFDEIFNYKL